MRYNKLKAFTMAELMVLLLTLTILLAAFSPVFTTRYSNYSSDDVWSFVPGDDENDAYYDVTNKAFSAQAFIGLTPAGPADVTLASADGSLRTLYSKLVIRASDKIKIAGVERPQNQIQFRYGSSFSNSAGSFVGALFAGNENFLVGGNYQDIKNTATYNTAYGVGAMTALTTGKYNTAIGYYAANQLTTGTANTVVGANAGSMTTQTGNTLVGDSAGNITGSLGAYNTIVGYNAVNNSGSLGSSNTFVGNHIASGNSTTVSTAYNVGVGNTALNKLTSGSYNTAIGYGALSNNTTGKFNTAVGINACTQVEGGSYKTCIGAYSGSTTNHNGTNVTAKSALFTDDYERIYIGGAPAQYVTTVSTSERPAAVLEVHNVPSSSSTSRLPIKNAADASVVINGNLIVRGQTYLETPIRRPGNQFTVSGTKYTALESPETDRFPKGLTAYRYDTDLAHKVNNIYMFSGADGVDRNGKSHAECNGCRTHAYDDIRQNCICTAVSSSGGTNTKYTDNLTSYPLSTSYDWTTPAAHSSSRSSCRKDELFGNSYTDASLNKTVTLSDNSGIDQTGDNDGLRESDDPMAHRINGSSCCPELNSARTSDRRLKNIGEKFTAGLAELNKLNIYNYTFKADANKIPYVGVIAQDLKTVFPNAVEKSADGYLTIRWDEMFYALVNAVKEINTKVTALASRITGAQTRITTLKKDNADLNAQLDKLAEELTVLEAKKK